MTTPDVAGFDAMSHDEAYAAAYGCLGVGRWAAQVASGRPYAAWPALRAAAADAAAELSDAELAEALGGHPRIGERPGAGHAVEHSRREQAGVDPADHDVAGRLAAGNAAYEERFGRVFLIRAAGRSADEILGELQRRLAGSDADERRETVAQLREIALLRLETVLS
ncbi:MAG: 2-oxo-4-hydroxy-4-carboxy-5-ureidoimidazoline decarboxylase [Lapillicoccus sp.]